jgi:hypothetical protein
MKSYNPKWAREDPNIKAVETIVAPLPLILGHQG